MTSASASPTPTILLPYLPPKTLVGIDLITFTSTPNFYGIRNLPPGWHFLYTGTTEGLSLRSGGWFYIHPDRNHIKNRGDGMQILVWKWNNNTESLEPVHAEQQEEGMRIRANMGALWRGGGLFGYRSRVPSTGLVLQRKQQQKVSEVEEDLDEGEEEGRKEWLGLTEYFSPRLLNRITGEAGAGDVDLDGRPRWVVTSGSTAKEDDDDIPGIANTTDPTETATGTATTTTTTTLVTSGTGTVSEKERELSFLPVDLKMTWREGAIGRERTEAARDRSWALGDIVQRLSSADNNSDTSGEAQILGELQFTFLMGLTVMNYSCLQQWKRLLRLILTCRRAIVDRASFMASVLRLLLLQLKRSDDVEGGLFDQLGGEGASEGPEFLHKLLKGFRTALYEEVDASELSVVKTEFGHLEAWVKSEFDWELNRDAVLRKGMLQLEDGEEVEMEMLADEEVDYQPVVVDLDEQSAEELR
ncbi:A1 cistron-splicing factor [Aspergillus californicus]